MTVIDRVDHAPWQGLVTHGTDTFVHVCGEVPTVPKRFAKICASGFSRSTLCRSGRV